MIEYNEFNYNFKIAAILAHDVDSIYLFQQLLSGSLRCLTAISGPIVSPSAIVRVGIQLPKIGQKGKDSKHSLKWGGMSKLGEDHKRWRECLKCKKLLSESKSKKKIY